VAESDAIPDVVPTIMSTGVTPAPLFGVSNRIPVPSATLLPKASRAVAVSVYVPLVTCACSGAACSVTAAAAPATLTSAIVLEPEAPATCACTA
jgi:hypothetical protein